MAKGPATPANFTGTGTGTVTYRLDEISSGIYEPATWVLPVTGFGLVGTRLRRRAGIVA